MNSRARWATAPGVAKSWTRLRAPCTMLAEFPIILEEIAVLLGNAYALGRVKMSSLGCLGTQSSFMRVCVCV